MKTTRSAFMSMGSKRLLGVSLILFIFAFVSVAAENEWWDNTNANLYNITNLSYVFTGYLNMSYPPVECPAGYFLTKFTGMEATCVQPGMSNSSYVPYIGASNNVNLNNFNLTNVQRIGIGTASPNSPLHVIGTANITGALYANNLTLNVNKEIGWRYASENPTICQKISGGELNPMNFTSACFSANTAVFTFNGNIGRNLMTIMNGGNVGIGTTSPGSNLEVNGSSGQVQILRSSSTGGAYATFMESTTARGYIGSGAGILTSALSNSLGIRSQGAFHIGTGGDNVRVTVDSANGNVGIGTTTPITKLNVHGVLMLNATTQPTCSGVTEGSIYYNGTSKMHYGCNSSNWNALY